MDTGIYARLSLPSLDQDSVHSVQMFLEQNMAVLEPGPNPLLVLEVEPLHRPRWSSPPLILSLCPLLPNIPNTPSIPKISNMVMTRRSS
jgi:hypothetical protein